ncbi:hypothetical protein K7432_007846 [Basidiobolus ranarum]|uniref:PAS domain-containing protein n=1 Tax=Basidiobolus ranarum TaxID=34480 RepID=A0ABR2VZQ9_9FUNG
MSSDISYIVIADKTKPSIIGPDLQIIFVSTSVKKVLGFEWKECLGYSPFEFLDEKDFTNVLRAFNELEAKEALGGLLYLKIRGKFKWNFVECSVTFCHELVFFVIRTLTTKPAVSFWDLNSLTEAIYLVDKEGITRIEEQVNYRKGVNHIPTLCYDQKFTEWTSPTNFELRVGLVIDITSGNSIILFSSESSEWMFGVPHHAILDTSFEDYVHKEDLEDFREELCETIQEHSLNKCYFTLVTPKGEMEVEGLFCYSNDAVVLVLKEATSWDS